MLSLLLLVLAAHRNAPYILLFTARKSGLRTSSKCNVTQKKREEKADNIRIQLSVQEKHVHASNVTQREEEADNVFRTSLDSDPRSLPVAFSTAWENLSYRWCAGASKCSLHIRPNDERKPATNSWKVT